MFTGQPDERLLALADRRPELFARFYRRYERVVVGYLARRTRDPELVIDLAAETFARAYEGRLTYDPRRGPAAAWLVGIARHVLASSLERGRVEIEARERLGMERLVIGERTFASVERTVLESSEVAADEWLASLPQSQREAVMRHVLDEESYEQIAASLGCSEAVVRQRTSRGLAALRRRAMEEQ